MNTIGSRKLIGLGIFSQDGTHVGEVQGVDIDLGTWKVIAIEARLERDALEVLELKKPIFGTQAVRIDVTRISGVSEKVILKDPMKGLVFVPLES